MSRLKIKNNNEWIPIPAGGVGVPAGGTSGQVLKKSSSTNYDTEWGDSASGSGIHIGDEAPTDPNIEVWIDPNDEGQSVISVTESSDLNTTIQSNAQILHWVSTTFNTPFSEGLTICAEGIAISYCSPGNYATQLALPLSDRCLYTRVRFPSGWSAWQPANQPKLGTVTLPLPWTDSGNGYYTVTPTLTGAVVTSNSRVDINPDSSAIMQLVNDDVHGLYINNVNGVLTAYAIGAAPTVALTIQATIVEVW